MRRFQFRLERFLELRRWKEREWEIALAKVLGECLLLEKRIEEIAKEVSASMLSAFVAGVQIDVRGMARRELYLQRLAHERERTQAALVEGRKELEKVRAKYLDAAKERKVLDKLKDRRSEEYYAHQLDEEYKSIDDMNTSSRDAARGRRARTMVGRGDVAEFSEVRPGVRIFILFLLLIVLTLGGIIWFDYLGLVDAKAIISPVYRLLGFEKRSNVASADDPNLLDRERLAKEQDALALRQQDLDTRSASLAQKEKELNQLGQDLNDRDAALTAREKAFNDQVKAFDNRRVNIAQNATYLTSMPPANAVAIMAKMGDQDVIDIFRTVEQQAQKAGVDSVVPLWLSMLSADKAADLQRKMAGKTGG